ncbi:MAG: SpoIVB peptidase [Clostridiales bacterium]|nr:SpoIVB peptidase [Clostridiales bacterium]
MRKKITILLVALIILSLSIYKENQQRTIFTNTLSDKKIAVSGDAIGVKLKLNGVMILEIGHVLNEKGHKEFPLRRSGIKVGDIVIGFNEKKVDNILDFLDNIKNSKGKKFCLTINRKGRSLKRKLKAVRSYEDNEYHLGVWVRDSIKGIGTITFYDPDTKYFGALGHGITDMDTRQIFNSKGEILESSILTVRRGKIGIPGELKGVFVSGSGKIGNILKNTHEGIYGILKQEGVLKLNNKLYEISPKENITCDKASIITNVVNNKSDEYDIEILKVYRNNKKGMNIRIVDPRLINTTGGIVQGMSGCPILQNGKIVGAVTHVFVNDPTRGYGIFIENMLNQGFFNK